MCKRKEGSGVSDILVCRSNQIRCDKAVEVLRAIPWQPCLAVAAAAVGVEEEEACR